MGMSCFPCFSKICSELGRVKAGQRIHQPLIWPTSHISAMVSVIDFLSEISSTALDVLICYSRLHITNVDVNFGFKGIMIKFSLKEEKRLIAETDFLR